MSSAGAAEVDQTSAQSSPVGVSVPRTDTAVLDLDGTLVDSVYVHTLAWKEAFRHVGIDVPSHHLHRAIGMGGDRLVGWVAGDAAESAVGDEVRRVHDERLDARFGDIVPTPGATDLLQALRAHHVSVVLASSSPRELTDRLLDLVEGARSLLQETVTSSEAEHSKPSGQLIEVALASVDARRSLVIGDAVWDARAAGDARVSSVGVGTGGFTEAELRGAGMRAFFDSPAELAEHLGDVLSLP